MIKEKLNQKAIDLIDSLLTEGRESAFYSVENCDDEDDCQCAPSPEGFGGTNNVSEAKLIKKLSVKRSANGYDVWADGKIIASFDDEAEAEEAVKQIQLGNNSSYKIKESIDLFEDENGQYYIEVCGETLHERRIHIRINAKGQRIKKIKCPKGRVARTVNGRTVCVTPSGREKLAKKLAIKKAVRTKKAKGAGARKKANFKRQKALRKRKQMGL